MASAVIRVEEFTHATLRSWAEAEQKPIGQIVTELVERQATDKFWREMREGYEQLRADPAAWADYQAEAAAFAAGSMDGLEHEAPYYSADKAAEIEQAALSRGW